MYFLKKFSCLCAGIVLLNLVLCNSNIVAQSNVNGQLMLKNYDKITFLTTHNAFNNDQDGFSLPNQNFSITRQLVDGVRALMIDVYEKNNELVVYHGYFSLGHKPLSYSLSQIRDFLDNNPNEVITLILECYTSSHKIETALTDAGLINYVYSRSSDENWPAISDLVQRNKRLVIFSDKNDASSSQNWYHYLWKYAVETSFEAKDKADFNSTFNRGKASNTFFILNHFLTSSLGTGSRTKAEAVNSNPFFESRISKVVKETGKRINFLTVDFYELGNCIELVNTLNGIPQAEPNYQSPKKLLLYPNPITMNSIVVMPDSTKAPFQFRISSFSGTCLYISKNEWKNNFTILKQNLSKGVYLLNVIDVCENTYSFKIIVN